MRGSAMGLVAAASLGCLLSAAAMADDEDGGAKQCVQLSRVRSTDVLDDQSVLFYMRDGSIYLNHLPLSCPRLGREKRFMYRVHMAQLCDVDTITVLEDFGLGLQPGVTCKLGRFNPISKTQAKELKAGPHERLYNTESVDPGKTEADPPKNNKRRGRRSAEP
ncbi:MAG TPA: hypothetical protein VFY39_17795 [Gammaproteobacteria bacterium]|nr:hypothetical protein [Gammaproteobacteria bacterium]